MQNKINVMNIMFDNVTQIEALNLIFKYLNKDNKGYICTPNPEMLLEAQKNSPFLNVINNSLLNIADGIGILWAAYNMEKHNSKLKAILNLPLIALYPKKFKTVLKERVTGTDLIQKICERSAGTPYKVFLLGAVPGIAEITKEKLQQKSPALKIVGTFAGSAELKDKDTIVQLINKSEADILFVAFGAPKQEMWIYENLKNLKTVKIAIGVGGAFDFISGKRKRAPVWMQIIGLEWLYRLFQEPTRWKRIYNATIKFPIEIIKLL
ncbi:WecB/TagA/CpsF family glycosyltransferase [Candidatus Peregrinibacteria bacterium]|nr:WecB/TagA/CpsF family glycosyltransferase [Candidatus Peregrinibacteria bacterium]